MLLPIRPRTSLILRPGISRIDWSHPLARGMICAYLPGICAGADLSGYGNNLLPIASYSGVTSQTIEGTGVKANAANSGLIGSSAGVGGALFTGNNITIYWRAQILGAAQTSGSEIFGLSFPAGSPFVGCYLSSSQTWYNNGGFVNGPNYTYPAAGLHDICVTFGLNGGTITVYIDGASVASGASLAGAPTAGTYQMNLNGTTGSDASRFPNATTLCGYMWNRLLTAQEVRFLNTSPYDMFVWPDDEIFATMVGVSVVADTLYAQACM